MGRYDDKRAVITGGSSGIGFATARLLIDQGACPDHRARRGRPRRRPDELGGHTVAVTSDTASLTDIAALAHRVASEFGTIDALFVNAGATRFAPFEATTEQMYDELLAINTKGPYFTVQALAPLLAPGSGVVLTTSVANVLGIPMVSAYAASKAALRSMARALARELLERQVRVNAVSPGAIDTGMLDRAMPQDAADQAKAQMTAGNPMLRFGRPDEVAAAAVFLAFEATYTNGAELPVDGGGSQL